MFYIFKNASVKVCIKFLKSSKNIKESLKQIHGYFCDELTVYHIERIRKLLIKNGKLKYLTEFCDHRFNELNPLKTRDTLTFHSILNEGLIQLLPKLNICFIKNIDAINLKIDSGTFLRLLNPGLLNIRIYFSTVNGNDDISIQYF